MAAQKKVTFKQLLVLSFLSSIIVGFSSFYIGWHEKSLGLSISTSVLFMFIFLSIMCWMYKINPFKKNFESPYTND